MATRSRSGPTRTEGPPGSSGAAGYSRCSRCSSTSKSATSGGGGRARTTLGRRRAESTGGCGRRQDGIRRVAVTNYAATRESVTGCSRAPWIDGAALDRARAVGIDDNPRAWSRQAAAVKTALPRGDPGDCPGIPPRAGGGPLTAAGSGPLATTSWDDSRSDSSPRDFASWKTVRPRDSSLWDNRRMPTSRGGARMTPRTPARTPASPTAHTAAPAAARAAAARAAAARAAAARAPASWQRP